MNPELRAYLESLGLAADATERQAWIYYHQLGDEHRAAAQEIRFPNNNGTNQNGRSAGAGGSDDGNADGGGTQTVTLSTGTREGDGGGTQIDGQGLDSRASVDDAIQVERTRVAQIRQLGRDTGIPDERIDGAIEDGSTLDQFRALALDHVRNQRGTGVGHDPAGVGHDGPDHLGRALPQFQFQRFAVQARRNPEGGQRAAGLAMALMMRSTDFGTDDPVERLMAVRQVGGGVRVRQLRELPDEAREHLERARDFAEDNAAMSLAEIAGECIRMDGHELVGGGARGVTDTLAQRGFSSGTLNNVFTTNFSAEFIGGYMGYMDTTAPFTSEGSLPNFLDAERTRNKKGSPLTRHTSGSTADSVSFDDKMEKYRLGRYTGKFVVDEMDIINDRFGGTFQEVAPKEMGEAAAELRPNLVYAILLANANMEDGVALFAAGHGNANTSSGFNPANIKAGVVKLCTQQENGRNLGHPSQFVIITPEAHRFDARQYVRSPAIYEDGGFGGMNSLTTESFITVADSRLDNGVIDPRDDASYAGSPTTWYMAVANSRHTIEVGYLRGSNRQPSIRNYQLTEGQWGMGWDVKHDIGAKALDWLGLQRFVA